MVCGVLKDKFVQLLIENSNIYFIEKGWPMSKYRSYRTGKLTKYFKQRKYFSKFKTIITTFFQGNEPEVSLQNVLFYIKKKCQHVLYFYNSIYFIKGFIKPEPGFRGKMIIFKKAESDSEVVYVLY